MANPIRQISLLRYAPALVLILIVAADSGQYPDPDLWGHLRFGQAALASGHVVNTDSYSYSAAQDVWLNHEWLSEMVMAFAYKGLGVAGYPTKPAWAGRARDGSAKSVPAAAFHLYVSGRDARAVGSV